MSTPEKLPDGTDVAYFDSTDHVATPGLYVVIDPQGTTGPVLGAQVFPSPDGEGFVVSAPALDEAAASVDAAPADTAVSPEEGGG